MRYWFAWQEKDKNFRDYKRKVGRKSSISFAILRLRYEFGNDAASNKSQT